MPFRIDFWFDLKELYCRIHRCLSIFKERTEHNKISKNNKHLVFMRYIVYHSLSAIYTTPLSTGITNKLVPIIGTTASHSVQYCKRHNCHPALCYLNSDKLFLTLSDWYHNPEGGFALPEQSQASYEASTLPPSHHGRLSPPYVLIVCSYSVIDYVRAVNKLLKAKRRGGCLRYTWA